MANNALLEANMNKMINESIDFGKIKYASYLEEAKQAYFDSHNTPMSPVMESTLIKNLKGTEDYLSSKGYDVQKYIKEETTPGDINAFIHHAFDMVTAILPNSIIEEFATIQGMDKRIGEVFYMDIIKGTNKGHSRKGDPYLSSQYGPNTGEDYSDDRITNEVFAVGDGTHTTFGPYTTEWTPIAASYAFNSYMGTLNYTIAGTSYTATVAPTTGTITGFAITSGTLNPTTRVLNVVFSTAPDNLTNITVSYSYDSAVVGAGNAASGGLPEVDVKLTSTFVTAKRRALKTKWLLDTAAMLSKEHGKDIEKTLLDSVISGVMNETAVELAADQYAAASAGLPVSFSKTPPSTTIPYILHRQEFLGQVVIADTQIEQAVRKIKADYIIGGLELSNLTRGMPADLFKPADYAEAVPTGMHVIGKLNNQYKVIQNFDYAPSTFVVGAKGNSWLLTGQIYSPFIPLMTTKPITDENLNTFRSLVTWYGKSIINSKFYNRGVITA